MKQYKISNFILENLVLPIGDFILGSTFIYNLRLQRRLVTLSEQELHELQSNRLNYILNYAKKNSLYYKSLNIPYSDDPFLHLKQFPVLTKYKLKANQTDILVNLDQQLLPQFSSGSSGVQSKVFWTKDEQSYHRATQVLWWEWAGYKLGMPIVQTGITPQRGLLKALKDILLHTYYIPAFVNDNKVMSAALKWALNKKKVFLGGYASSLYIISKYALSRSINVNFQSAISWGDKLFSHYLKSINNAFGVKVYETYGSAEGLMIAAQKDLDYMYIMSPNVVLEILNDSGEEVEDGQMGHVVITSLVAKGFPLIRYKIGDLAIKLPKDQYPKNRELKLPLLEKVIGRETDFVKTPKGKIMIVHSFTGIFEHYPEITQFCVIQNTISGIEIQYIPDHYFQKSILTRIQEKLQEYINEPDFEILFMEVKVIKATPSGKPQIIVSNLDFNNNILK